jgi:hypothetical protein
MGRDRLRMWKPVGVRAGLESDGTHASLTEADIDRVAQVLALGWEEGTAGAYGSGLLVYHVFCDLRAIPEAQRAPTSKIIITSFVTTLAGAYSHRTISSYVFGVRAWHILHGMTWSVNRDELAVALRAAARLAPPSSKRKERQPYTVEHMEKLSRFLDPNDTLDAAVFACLTITFYAAARCGETTVKNLKTFDVTRNVTREGLSSRVDAAQQVVTVLRVPFTKTKPEGEDIYWSVINGRTDPQAALENHLRINNPPLREHLFAYKANGEARHRPLTKKTFIARLQEVATEAGEETLQGHGIRIGATLHYLMNGATFETMKVKGRWSSDAFKVYVRRHAQIVAPMLQNTPVLDTAFARVALAQEPTA